MAKHIVDRLKNKGINIEELINILNKAYASEKMAYEQYKAPIGLLIGINRSEIEKDFQENAEEEHKHAEMLRDRIIKLDGIPLDDPELWKQFSPSPFRKPKYNDDNNIELLPVLIQNLQSENEAIDLYESIMDMTRGFDDVTFHLCKQILEDEITHSQELEDFIKDLK